MAGGKASTDDIRQTLGVSGRPVNKYQILTLFASFHTRDGDESQQDGTFVASLRRHVWCIS